MEPADLSFPTWGRLLAPVAVDHFWESLWDKEAVWLQDQTSTRQLLAGFDLDVALETSGRSSAIEVLGPADRCHSVHEVGSSAWLNQAGGPSLRVMAVQRFSPGLMVFLDSLEAEFGHPMSVNLYVSPPGSQGLNPHVDRHDVLVLQVMGSKEWRLWPRVPPSRDPAIFTGINRDPGEGHRRQPPAECPIPPFGDAERDLCLTVGDLLYLPRGVPHVARTNAQPSAHLTIGCHQIVWADVLATALASERARPGSALAEPLPIGAFRALIAGNGLPTLGSLLPHLSSGTTESALAVLAGQWLHRHRPPVSETASPQTALDSETRLRRSLPLWFLETTTICSLAAYRVADDVVTLPRSFAPALRFVATTDGSWRLYDLPGLDEGSRFQLCVFLKDRGYLEVAPITCQTHS